jgi:hypothetical protein
VRIELEHVLIRGDGAGTPHAYDGIAADTPWRISGVVRDSGGAERVIEISFASLEEATVFASRELGLAGTWADPDGDGDYCIVD